MSDAGFLLAQALILAAVFLPPAIHQVHVLLVRYDHGRIAIAAILFFGFEIEIDGSVDQDTAPLARTELLRVAVF